MLSSIRNTIFMRLILRSPFINSLFVWIMCFIKWVITVAVNYLFHIRQAIDLDTNKSVLISMYIQKFVNISNKKYDRLYINYKSAVRCFETVLKGNSADITNILKTIEKDRHTYQKILLKNNVVLNSVTIDTVNILPFMKHFVRYNADITLHDVLQIHNIDYAEKIMMITHYDNFTLREKVIYDIDNYLHKNIIMLA